MQIVKVTCEGEAPLLMEPMSDAVLESLRTGKRLPINKDRSADEIAGEKIYRDESNNPCIPADNLWSCLVEAGRLVSFKGKQNISNASESLLGGLLRIKEEFLPLQNGGPITHRVDKRRGRLPDGTAVCLVRPRFDHWGFSATLHINDEQIDDKKMKELFGAAGTFKGIGGHRKKGSFGRFVVTSWEVIGGDKKKAAKKALIAEEGGDDAGTGDES
jgi:hypothetical protein